MPSRAALGKFSLASSTLLVLLVLAVLQAAIQLPMLPEMIPAKPSRPQSGLSSKWMLPVLAAILLCPLTLLHAFARPLVERYSSNFSLPDWDYWLAPENAAATRTDLVTALQWFTVALAAMLLALVQGIYRMHLNPAGYGVVLALAAVVGLLGASVCLPLWTIWRFRSPPA